MWRLPCWSGRERGNKMSQLSPEFPDVYKITRKSWRKEKKKKKSCSGFPAPIAAGLSPETCRNKKTFPAQEPCLHSLTHHPQTFPNPLNKNTLCFIYLFILKKKTNTRCKQNSPTERPLWERIQNSKQRQKVTKHQHEGGKKRKRRREGVTKKSDPFDEICYKSISARALISAPSFPVRPCTQETAGTRRFSDNFKSENCSNYLLCIYSNPKPKHFSNTSCSPPRSKTAHTHRPSISQNCAGKSGRTRACVCVWKRGRVIHHSGSTYSLLTDAVLFLLGRNPARHPHSNEPTIRSEWSSLVQAHPQLFLPCCCLYCFSVLGSRI